METVDGDLHAVKASPGHESFEKNQVEGGTFLDRQGSGLTDLRRLVSRLARLRERLSKTSPWGGDATVLTIQA